MKKNKIIPLIITIVNTLLCSLMLALLLPNTIPLLAGIHDEIIVMGSKWWLLAGIILPIILMIFLFKTKNNYLRLILTELIIFVAYINMIAYSFFINTDTLSLGMRSEAPLSIVVFVPIALSCFVYGSIIKNLPYKSKLGLRSKRTLTTEFIWTQSHISASYYYRLTGLILFVIAIVFTFLHLPLIELAIFILILLIPRIIIEINANKMTKKYKDMQAKHEHLINKKANPK